MYNPFMKTQITLLLTFFAFTANLMIAQDVLHNHGNLKIHDFGAVGFHLDVINDGIFDDNLGLAGFYSDDIRTISGAFRPIFYDIEVVAPNDLILEVGIGVTNNANFVLGDVQTPRTLIDINLDFISDSFYASQTGLTKIDGYGGITNKTNFVVPIGDENKLRPLEITSDSQIESAKSAYFFEDPNYPTAFLFPFDTENNTDILNTISTHEFWDLDSNEVMTIKLTWDNDSRLSTFVDEIENLRIAGWHTTNEIWENLGGNMISGDFDSGEITSDSFTPDNYSAITFGSSLSAENINLTNYLLTPNNDGINDFLHFDAVSLSPENNSLKVYNRWGRLVFEAEGYQNNFNGSADNGLVIAVDKNLPDGVYFYILELQDVNVLHQGYFAIRN